MKRYVILAMVALVVCGSLMSRAEVRYRQEPGISVNGLSTDTKPTSSVVYPGDKFIETDTGNVYIFNGTAWSILGGVVSAGPDTLEAPAKSIAAVSTGFNSAAWYIDVSSIDTNITVYLEAKNNLSDWTNVNANGDSTIITLDGTTVLQYTGLAPADSTRIFFSGESGGTGAVLAITSERWNQ